MAGGRRRLSLLLIMAALVLMAGVSVGRAASNALAPLGSLDLGISLKAAQLLQREDPYVRHASDPIAGDPAAAPERNPHPMVPVQAPSALMLLWPYSFLSWPAAKIAWLLSNLAFTAGLLVLAFRRFLPDRPWPAYVCLACLFLMGAPWRNVVGNGQHLIASLFFFLLAMDLADGRRTGWSGMALALALLKYTVTFFLLPWFLYRRQWRPVLIAGAVHAALTLGAALRLGADPVAMVIGSVRVASGILTFEGYLDLFALARIAEAPAWVAAGLAILILPALCWAALTRRVTDGDLFLAGLCMLSVVLVYHRRYDYVILIVPLLVAIRGWRASPATFACVAGSAALIWYVDRLLKAFVPPLHANGSAFHVLVALLWYAAAALFLGRALAPGRTGRFSASSSAGSASPRR